MVVLDTVSFTKNSFFNRNQLRGPNGLFWLTIPVKTHGRFAEPISQIQIDGNRWIKKHRTSVEQTLMKAPHFDMMWHQWSTAYDSCSSTQSLSDVNQIWLSCILSQLRITTNVHRVEDLSADATDKNARLIQICERLGAKTYRTGPKGLNYLDLRLFDAHGISVEAIDYQRYYQYLVNEESPVSVLESLAYLGDDCRSIMKHHYVPLTPS